MNKKDFKKKLNEIENELRETFIEFIKDNPKYSDGDWHNKGWTCSMYFTLFPSNCYSSVSLAKSRNEDYINIKKDTPLSDECSLKLKKYIDKINVAS